MCGFKFPWTHLEDKRLTSPHRNKFVGICGGGGGGGEGGIASCLGGFFTVLDVSQGVLFLPKKRYCS